MGMQIFLDEGLEINLNKFLFSYSNIFQWSLANPTKIQLNPTGVATNEIKFIRENAENITISGQYFFQ
jgi:hypothetical protein